MANSTIHAEFSTPIPQRTYVVIDDAVGIFLAERLDLVIDTIIISANNETAASAERAGLETRRANVTDPHSLALAGLSDAELVIVASESDARNLLLAQILRTTFGITDVIVRLTDPRNVNAFDDIDIEMVCMASRLTEAVVERLES